MSIFSIGKFPKKHWDGNIKNNYKPQNIFFSSVGANSMSTSIKFSEYNNKHKLEDISKNP